MVQNGLLKTPHFSSTLTFFHSTWQNIPWSQLQRHYQTIGTNPVYLCVRACLILFLGFCVFFVCQLDAAHVYVHLCLCINVLNPELRERERERETSEAKKSRNNLREWPIFLESCRQTDQHRCSTIPTFLKDLPLKPAPWHSVSVLINAKCCCWLKMSS